MRILQCKIENFGILHEQTIDFERGITTIRQPNGWGKSTLAVFICAMFYGLAGEKKRSLEKERVRYNPWQGGSFGGSILFEVGGREYVMTRKFGNRAAADFFEIRDAKTNIVSFDYTAGIGEELFGIDRESFRKTIFITQNGCETDVSDSINAKISNLDAYADDLGNYDDADQKLAQEINSRTPARKTGSLYKLEEEISRLARIVRGGESLPERMAEDEKELHAYEEEYQSTRELIDEVSLKREQSSAAAVARAKLDERERLCAKAETAENRLAQYQKDFPEGIPAREEIVKLAEEGKALQAHENAAALLQLLPEEREAYRDYRNARGDTIPAEDELSEIRDNVTELQKLYGRRAASGTDRRIL